MKKKEISALYMQQFASIFACPICSSSMSIIELTSIVCEKNHTFDIAKQGYVNFLTRPVQSEYDKELFEARKIVIHSGLYEPLHKMIRVIIGKKEGPKILDTGCGEGSHLAHILKDVNEAVGVGIDIAKEGILTAAKSYSNMIWCVGDLAKSPFSEESFDIILNILSPANYTEFTRLLKPDGLLIKVVPKSGYLKEIRNLFYNGAYSNEQTVDRFKENFEQIDTYELSYKVPLHESLIQPLLRMTPLTWNKIDADKEVQFPEISIDLDILVGRQN
ncbi:methyltransferase domain-containing protein [Bacillus sp. FJAT-49711]|uniref:putative RNA methyltransferase n=1 Tax=Bacillus sp. FJAT-49711 TaxID=2833585 RepID=UPI001BC971E6|nr:methyltransferase domain-containing protein [Bacillus sp. FJAT-49711]MBS4218263.1 methyltransferase domain-containing protein [Bacillus sp. FJAT-49711]